MLENSGARHPNDAEANRKRHKHRGSPGSAEDEDRALGNMFDEPTLSRSRGDDPEEDDMDDFIEEDEDEEIDEETRAQLRRQKKEAKRANARKVRSNAGVGQELVKPKRGTEYGARQAIWLTLSDCLSIGSARSSKMSLVLETNMTRFLGRKRKRARSKSFEWRT